MNDSRSLGPPEPMKPIKWWHSMLGLIVVSLVFCASVYWFSAPSSIAYSESDLSPEQVVNTEVELARMESEARRNALAATAGVVAIGALLLAFRRQLHNEHQQKYNEYQQRYQENENQEAFDQRERRTSIAREEAQRSHITDLRVRAVEQLASDSPSVRIGGLHNLERLGDQNPELRQIILDEICSYLRLPYIPPESRLDTSDESDSRKSSSSDSWVNFNRNSRAELEVRQTAQEILQRHLNLSADRQHYWEHDRINLSEAFLFNINFSNCKLKNAKFENSIFSKWAQFHKTELLGQSIFVGAKFNDRAFFASAVIEGALFGKSTFHRIVDFENAKFYGRTSFDNSLFKSRTRFTNVSFHGWTSFKNSKFENIVDFIESKFFKSAYLTSISFCEHADFSKVNFNSNCEFKRSSFENVAVFDEAIFKDSAVYSYCKFSSRAYFRSSEFFDSIYFDKTEWDDDTDFSESVFKSNTVFNGSQFRAIFRLENSKFLGAISCKDSAISHEIASQNVKISSSHSHKFDFPWRIVTEFDNSKFGNLIEIADGD